MAPGPRSSPGPRPDLVAEPGGALVVLVGDGLVELLAEGLGDGEVLADLGLEDVELFDCTVFELFELLELFDCACSAAFACAVAEAFALGPADELDWELSSAFFACPLFSADAEAEAVTLAEV